MKLTDAQWDKVKDHIPESNSGAGRRGRPRADNRQVLEGILWLLKTGARWEDLPKRYPPKSTCHDRLTEWCKLGVFQRIWVALVEDLNERGKLNWKETFIDDSFAAAKKGSRCR